MTNKKINYEEQKNHYKEYYDKCMNDIRNLERKEYFYTHRHWNMALYSYGEIRKYRDFYDELTFRSKKQYIIRDTNYIGKRFLGLLHTQNMKWI
tara:strand:+ start:189 stop:470 length:282 start_codon:yes stop_codon:yes gene_type:complete